MQLSDVARLIFECKCRTPNVECRMTNFFLNRHPELKKHTEGIEQLNFPRTAKASGSIQRRICLFILTVVIKEQHSQPSMQILRDANGVSNAVLESSHTVPSTA